MKQNKIHSYNIEVLRDIYKSPSEKKPLLVKSYTLELLQSFVPEEEPAIAAFYFTGQISDQAGPVAREIVSYDSSTYRFTDISMSNTDGNFTLGSTTSGVCFLVALDDIGGVDYNHLIAASVTPAIFDDYGYSPLNPGASARDIKESNPAATTDGLYWLQPDTYTTPVQVYCDMTTQGGGWTMCARWDRDFPHDWESVLPLGAMRNNINTEGMQYVAKEASTQSSTLDIRPLLEDGATLLMHTSLDTGEPYWKHLYFSQIYSEVMDTPENVFDASFDTNDAESVLGAVVSRSTSFTTAWFDYNMDLMSSYNLARATDCNYGMKGGEARAMFNTGSRNGASFSSNVLSTGAGSSNDWVFWGFYGKDGSIPNDTSYDYPMCVGTSKNPNLPPAHRFNFIFIR